MTKIPYKPDLYKMKDECENIHLYRVENLLDYKHGGSEITVELARLDDCVDGRRQRRKDQSLIARKLLDSTLQKLFGRDKSALWSLEKKPSGQPFLLGEDTPSVSIAHSSDWVVCAVASSVSVGVDVEIIKTRDWEAYSREVFHPLEAHWVLGVAGNERNIRGLTCWCLKEAVVKAIGIGMVFSPSEIGFSPEGTLIALPEQLGSPSGWLTHSTVVHGEAVVAVAWKC